MSDSELRRRAEAFPWSWHPKLPIGNSPVYAWPPRPLQAANHVLGRGFLWGPSILYVGLAIATWLLFGPHLERCAQFEARWIAEVYLINLGSVIVLAGGLHLYFYVFKAQGSERRIDPSELGRSPKFLGGYQIWDNIFWTCVSGVTIWTAYTVLFMWAYANDLIPWLHWNSGALGRVWFLALFPLLVIWESMHFYFIHRLLHYKPFYRWHALHHRNINIGPWSGFSMHPVEHVLYFSNVLIHLVVASHPIHMFYNMYYTAFAAVTSHTGYSALMVKGKAAVNLGSFFHQIHHRYFDCNYGSQDMPWDQWLGSFHDGTPEATARVREYQLGKRGRKRQSPEGVQPLT